MSSGGHAASSSACAIRPRGEGTGSTGSAERRQRSSPIGRYVMATVEHREPCVSRGSCTVLGAPGGEIPPGDSTILAQDLPVADETPRCGRLPPKSGAGTCGQLPEANYRFLLAHGPLPSSFRSDPRPFERASFRPIRRGPDPIRSQCQHLRRRAGCRRCFARPKSRRGLRHTGISGECRVRAPSFAAAFTGRCSRLLRKHHLSLDHHCGKLFIWAVYRGLQDNHAPPHMDRHSNAGQPS